MGLFRKAAIALAPLAAMSVPAAAVTTSFCVSCVDPDRTYICNVETSGANPGVGALQFYCISHTAKEEGHASCAVSKQSTATCAGVAKTYVYQGVALPSTTGPALPPTAAPALPPTAPAADGTAAAAPQPLEPTASPPSDSGPPKTVAEAVRNSGRAVKDAAQDTGEAARNAGSRVGDAAKSVSRAARTAFGCVWSLFRACGSDEP